MSIDLLVKTYTTEQELYLAIEAANTAYRAGHPTMSDTDYDALVAELARRAPEHPWLNQVEPEPITGKTIKLPERMLSTQKAYTVAELENWYKQIQWVASDLLITNIEVRVTPKLDGFAAYDAGDFQATRGDGLEGTNITHAFDRGLGIFNGSACTPAGKGEIVVDKEYFAKYLSDQYENTRNVIASVIKEGPLDIAIELAIAKGGVVFVPFNNILGFQTNDFSGWLTENRMDILWEKTLGFVPFDTDGLVIEVVNEKIKVAMGATNHHHRWQIAYKRNTEFHDCKVTGLTWQTGRTGKITPVVNIEPTRIGGVTVSNVTGHHAGNVVDRGIGEGAVVKVTRAGQVIPHIVEVVSTDDMVPVGYPRECPSCDHPTTLDGDHLLCTNKATCPAQATGTIEHFFKTIGDCDGFGPVIIDKVCIYLTNSSVNSSIRNFLEIVNESGLTSAGISSGVVSNLVEAYTSRQQKPLEDWKFLAAFGISGIGRGVSEKVLKQFTIPELLETSYQQMICIEGVGTVLGNNLFDGLVALGEDITYLSSKFNLVQTKGTATADSPIAGKTIVFTGTMVAGKRSDMEKQAKALGAIVTSSVTGKTDYLVAGENVGANKTAAAQKHGVIVMSEQQYLEMVAC